MIAMPLAGILVQYTGWSSVFYVYGEYHTRQNVVHHFASGGKETENSVKSSARLVMKSSPFIRNLLLQEGDEDVVVDRVSSEI